MSKIEDLRLKIDKIDKNLLDLIIERLKVVHEIGFEKKKNNLEVIDKSREKKIVEKLKEDAKLKGLDSDVVEKIWKVLMEISYEVEGGKNGNS